MTYGKQNTQEEAFEQMDYALKQGINFFDTVVIYQLALYGVLSLGIMYNQIKDR